MNHPRKLVLFHVAYSLSALIALELFTEPASRYNHDRIFFELLAVVVWSLLFFIASIRLGHLDDLASGRIKKIQTVTNVFLRFLCTALFLAISIIATVTVVEWHELLRKIRSNTIVYVFLFLIFPIFIFLQESFIGAIRKAMNTKQEKQRVEIKNMAKEMLQKGVSKETICKTTGLTLEEIIGFRKRTTVGHAVSEPITRDMQNLRFIALDASYINET